MTEIVNGLKYPVFIRPLSQEDGGGYLAQAIDLPGCLSDGETVEEAVHNLNEAIDEWIDEATRLGREVPLPGSGMRRAMDEREQMSKLLEQTAAVLASNDEKLKSAESMLELMRSELERMRDRALATFYYDNTAMVAGAIFTTAGEAFTTGGSVVPALPSVHGRPLLRRVLDKTH